MVVVSNPRHNSSPTTDLPRAVGGGGGARGMCGGMGRSLPLWVTLAKSLSLSGPQFLYLPRGRERKGVLVLAFSRL